MRIDTAWRALTSGRLLRTSWPWRCVLYLITGVLAGLWWLLLALALLTVGTALAVLIVGVPFLIGLALLGVPAGAVERFRLRLVDTRANADPHRPPPHIGAVAWARTRLTEQSTWRALGYVLLHATVLWVLDALILFLGLAAPVMMLLTPLLWTLAGDGEVKVLKLVVVDGLGEAWLAVPFGLSGLVVGGYLITLYSAWRAALARVMIAVPDTGGGDRLTAVTRSRARIVDAFDAERRRIERDLHDGAQRRLLAVGVTVGLARLAEGEEADRLLGQAQNEAALALEEIRELIRGVHPRVLTERGLGAALAEAVDHLSIPVRVDVDLPTARLPPGVETAAYFATCEALTNVARHSGATDAALTVGLSHARLRIEITDNGRGGADPERGSGLTGLADRVAVVDGELSLSSPPGGPTRVVVEIPCPPLQVPSAPSESSSPRTVS